MMERLLFVLVLFSLCCCRTPVLSNSEDVQCDLDHFQCHDGRCIHHTWVCDGTNDCIRGEDEEDCKDECSSRFFVCDNGDCVNNKLKCDGTNDCGDFSDEVGCGGNETTYAGCSKEEFVCKSTPTCILLTEQCNGFKDCPDGSDEKNCTVTCHTHQFRCFDGSYCVSKVHVCDGQTDCEDGSDEVDCSQEIYLCRHHPDGFLCDDHSDCILSHFVCDGHDDCDDGSDEKNNCSVACSSLKCDFACSLTPYGVKCICDEGYTLNSKDNRTCVDTDECSFTDEERACSQHCYNTPSSYYCRCNSGYELAPDRKSCKAKGYEPVLIYATANEIRSFSLHKHFYDVLLDDLDGVRGLAVDSNGGKIFWSEVGEDHHPGVYSIDHDNPKASRSTVVSYGLSTPRGLAFDYIEKNLYIADSGKPAIVACRTEGSVCVTVFNQSAVINPADVALDPKRGYIYWTEVSAVPAIMRGTMDGKSYSVFVSANLGLPVSLVVDLTTDRLFWIDSFYNMIEFVSLDGKVRKTVVGYKIAKPSMLSVFEDDVIWANKAKHNIVAANKFTGHNVRTIIQEVPEPTALVVYHSSLQSQNALSTCWTKLCSHICLLGPNAGSTCACPSGYILDSSERNCEVRTKSSFLLAADKEEIITVSLAKLTALNVSSHYALSMRDVFTIAYLAKSDEILYSDTTSDGKITLNLLSDIHTHPKTRRIMKDLRSVESLAVDESANVIYWVDAAKDKIEVASIDGVERGTLPVEQIGKPRALALDISRGLLYYSNIATPVTIVSCHQDGKSCFDLVYENLNFPSYIVVYGDRVYWSDFYHREISSVTWDGQDRQLHVESRNSILSFAIHGTTLFWTDNFETAILSVDVAQPNIESRIETHRSQLTGLTVAAPNRISVTKCSMRNGGCDHMCIPTPGNVTCMCSRNFQLQADLKTCKMVHTEEVCSGYLCADDTTCVPLDSVCDRHLDCPDASDEANCSDRLTCTEDEFLCTDGTCIFKEFVCDKDDDCRDGSDEKNCTDSAVKEEVCCCGQLACDRNMTCFFPSEICDGFDDCDDGSDEKNCLSPVCAEDKFTCRYKCIDMNLRCDGKRDCAEGDDEEDCPSIICSSHQFKCGSLCLESHQLCDGTSDCTLGEDESACPFPTECGVDQFRCQNGQCIEKDNVCDDFMDCSDVSDELPSLCEEIEKEKAKNLCEEGFKCLSGQCVEKHKFCDGHPDCRDGSDEGSCEYSNIATCKTYNPCDQICSDSPNGPICSCFKGFQVFDTSPFVCKDINECLTRNGDCTQKCVNHKGGHHCSCREGYKQGSNPRSCIAFGPRPYFLVGTPTGIKQISAESNTDHISVPTKSMPVAMDMNIHTQEVFWTEYLNQENHSAGMALYASTGKDTQKIILTEEIGGVAVDWVTGNVYFSKFSKSAKSGSIVVSNKKYFATLVPGLSHKAESLILHGRLRFLCFLMRWKTTESSESGVACYSLDGVAWFPPLNMMMNPVALSFDQANEILYCFDDQAGLIAYQLHLTYPRWFVLKIHTPQMPRQIYSMDVFEGVVYLTDQETNTIRKIATYDSDLDEEEVQVVAHPGPMKVVHTLRQPAKTDPCSGKTCMFICLHVGADAGMCRCKDGYQNRTNPNCEGQRVEPTQISNMVVHKSTLLPSKLITSTGSSSSPATQPATIHYKHVVYTATTRRPSLTCILHCQNGGTCVVVGGKDICRCAKGFDGKLCQTNRKGKVTEPSEEPSLVWVAGLVVGIAVIIIVAVGTFCFLKRRRANPSLIRAIKFQNPNLRHKGKDDKQELITEISFGNPGFRDEVDDETDSSGDQDWWKKLLARSRTSVDSAFVSKHSSLGGSLDVEEQRGGDPQELGTSDRHKLLLK